MNKNKVAIHKLYIIVILYMIFALRIFSMFMILPVIFITGLNLEHANTFLIGIAVGIYGLFQALFQIPLGILSDFIGRKLVIILCLFLFLLGSLCAAMSNSIEQFIFSRFLQGLGAISSTIMAYLSEITEEKNRTQVIFFLGIFLGFSFALSIILGPFILNHYGFRKLFFFISILIIFFILIVLLFFPSTLNLNIKKIILRKNIFDSIKSNLNFDTYILFFSIFCLHFILMFNFIIFPKKLLLLGIVLSDHWKIYFLTILISFLLIIFMIHYLEKKFSKIFLLFSFIFLLTISELIFLFSYNSIILLFLSIQFFFIAFVFLESFIPSTLSKIISSQSKGLIMGIYSTSQFIGSAIGGGIGGWVLYLYGLNMILYIIIGLCFLWLILIFTYCIKNYLI
ncbi:Inner membrane transport protein YajR [Buchnera aphidicola (Eriosoma grossulariae)]|uniref:MFS transporter n=1 Tax=Buchnera aphidicola TaxID=9 RepID=UPI003464A22C